MATIDFKNALINNCIVHKVGNKFLGQEIFLSKEENTLDESTNKSLTDYLTSHFNDNNEVNFFYHEIERKMNEVFVLSDNIFSKEDFILNTSNIVTHLYNQTRNPAIKASEILFVLLDEILFNNKICKGIGIFKSEKKDVYYKLTQSRKSIEINAEEGIGKRKFEKGCLILNQDYHDGYKVLTFENGADTNYWNDDFLSIKNYKDDFHSTKNFLALTKTYITKQLPEDFEVGKADQIDLLNRSVEYFKTHDNFDKKEFETEVFQDSGIIKSFRKFDDVYQIDNELELSSKFEISPQAVKKQAKIFKSILKLDKNFAIYIHGNRQLIEQGVEKDGRKFYKIYFNEES